MKILFIPTSYPDKDNPTRDIFIYEQARAMANIGYDIRVLHLKKQASRDFYRRIDKTITKEDDGFALRYSMPTKTFMENRFPGIHRKSFIIGMRRLYERATLDGWKPDVIYAHFSCWAGAAAVEIGKEHGIPVVVIEHYSGYMAHNVSSAKTKGLKSVVEKADMMLAVSDNLRESIVKLTGTARNIQVVPNMIDRAFQYSEHPVKEDFVFCSVCNLNPRKRVEMLVQAFCKAFEKEDSVRLLIGGDGPERPNIEKTIQQLKRENQIQMLGRLDRQGTLNTYKQSNCFALASAHETFGIVWREAMATGLPVITSNHEGWSKKDWSEDFGYMVNVDDEQGLSIAMRKMYDNYSRFDGKKISDFCLNNYSEKTVVAMLQDVFFQVCNSNSVL